MELSEILNLVLGGGLLAAVIGLLTLKATVRKANSRGGEGEGRGRDSPD